MPAFDRDRGLRLFALFFGLSLAAVQVSFIGAYFQWLGLRWPVAPLLAILLIGVPTIAALYGAEIQARYPLLAPLLKQAQSALWQIINAILIFAGALLGYGFTWWQSALVLATILVIPRVVLDLIRHAE